MVFNCLSIIGKVIGSSRISPGESHQQMLVYLRAIYSGRVYTWSSVPGMPEGLSPRVPGVPSCVMECSECSNECS